MLILNYKFFFITCLFLAACGLTITTALGQNHFQLIEEENTHKVKVGAIIKESLEIEINTEEPDPKDYFEEIGEENLSISYYKEEEKVQLDISKVDSYDVIIEGDTIYRTKLNIVDTTAPEVETKTITIYEKEKYEAKDFIVSYKDNSNDDNYTISFKEEEDSKRTTAGTYGISLEICDINKVCKEITVTLEIKKKTSQSSEKATPSTSTPATPSKPSSSPTTPTQPSSGTTTQTPAEEVTVVKTTTETVTIKTEPIKYGVEKVTTAQITYDVYSDGTKKEISRTAEKTTIDYSGFNGTVSSMKPEAISIYDSLSDSRDVILTKTNKYRTEKGISSLTLDKKLSILATVRAMEMAYGNKFSHTRPNGEPWYTFWEETGFNFTVPSGGSYGENLAYGYATDSGACQGWRNSTDHYSNMINEKYTKIGIGKYTLNGKTYWVQFFSS